MSPEERVRVYWTINTKTVLSFGFRIYAGLLYIRMQCKETGKSGSYRNISLAISKNTPPMTTNATAPKAQVLIRLRFSSFSLRDGLTGFLPARALSANCLFFWRSSNSLGIL